MGTDEPPGRRRTAVHRPALAGNADSAWFERLDAEGVIAGGLASPDSADHRRVLELMLGAVKERPGRMAELLAPYAGRAPEYPAWLSWVIRFGHVYESRALFDLVLAAVRRGDSTDRGRIVAGSNGLGEHQPGWAAELLGAYLSERPHAFDVDALGRIPALESRDHVFIELTARSSEQAPQAFLEAARPLPAAGDGANRRAARRPPGRRPALLYAHPVRPSPGPR